MITLSALPDIPEIRPGDDLATILGQAAGKLDGGLRPDDVLAVAHKVVSKAEDRIVRLAEVFPGWEAHQLAKEHDKDPHLMQVILDESHDLVRADRGRLICRTRHGFVCANAGVDQSNAGRDGTVILLPLDPDASARALRHELGCAVVITDSFGRAWRNGQCEVAIGSTRGLRPSGRPDPEGLAAGVAVRRHARGHRKRSSSRARTSAAAPAPSSTVT